MTTARLFKNGRSQAVRIPKALEFDAEEVEIVPRDDGIFIHPVKSNFSAFLKELAENPVNFPEELPPAPQQIRDLTW